MNACAFLLPSIRTSVLIRVFRRHVFAVGVPQDSIQRLSRAVAIVPSDRLTNIPFESFLDGCTASGRSARASSRWACGQRVLRLYDAVVDAPSLALNAIHLARIYALQFFVWHHPTEDACLEGSIGFFSNAMEAHMISATLEPDWREMVPAENSRGRLGCDMETQITETQTRSTGGEEAIQGGIRAPHHGPDSGQGPPPLQATHSSPRSTHPGRASRYSILAGRAWTRIARVLLFGDCSCSWHALSR